MKVGLEKPGTPEELVHFGVKGMKWGVRNRRDLKRTISNTKNLEKHLITKTPKAMGREVTKSVGGMSKKKKVALGVGVGVAAIGTAAVAGHILGSRGKIPISMIDAGESGYIRLKGGGLINNLTEKQWNTKISDSRRMVQKLDAGSRLGKVSPTSFRDITEGSRRKVRITGGEIFRS